MDTETAKYEVIHERHTDVVYVNVAWPTKGTRVDVLDVGDEVGFPGLIQLRVDSEQQIFYGLTIQNYSRFKRQFRLKYHMFSMQKALALIMDFVRVSFSRDHSKHHVYA